MKTAIKKVKADHIAKIRVSKASVVAIRLHKARNSLSMVDSADKLIEAGYRALNKK